MNVLTRALLLCSGMLLLSGAVGLPAQSVAARDARLGVARPVAAVEVGRLPARPDSVSAPRHVGMWGFIIGAVVGTGVGYTLAIAGCEGATQSDCHQHGAIGGAILGGLVGYGIERLVRWR